MNKLPILKEIKCQIPPIWTDFKFLSNLLLVGGDSAVGKSWVFQRLANLSSELSNSRRGDAISLAYFNHLSTYEMIAASQKDVVVVDEVDVLLYKYPRLMDSIYLNSIGQVNGQEFNKASTCYVLIGRGVKLSLSPESYVVLKEDEATKTLSFDYGVGVFCGFV